MEISAADLRIFETVANEGSVTSGASRLGLTQPAVSRALQRLEQELEVKLFIRSRRGVVLTRAGKQLSGHSKRLIADFDCVRDRLKMETQELRGVYTIGVHADLAGLTLPRFIAPLLEEHPQLEFRFVHDLSREITRRVASLEIDFGIVVNPLRYPDLTIQPLYQVNVGFWGATKSSWSDNLKKPRVPIICNLDLVQTGKLLKQIERRGIFLKPRLIHSASLQLITSLTASGAGVGIIPETEVKLHFSQMVAQLPDLPTLRDEICLVYRRDVLHGTAASMIRDRIIRALNVKKSHRDDLAKL